MTRYSESTNRVDVQRPVVLRISADDGGRVPVAIRADESIRTPVVDVNGFHDFNPAASLLGSRQAPSVITPASMDVDASDLASEQRRSQLGIRPDDIAPRAGDRILEIRIPSAPTDLDDRQLGRLAVQVPAGTRLDVRLDGSDVELTGRFGELSAVRSETGRVVGTDLSGPVDLDANHGAVDLTGVRGGVFARAQHGDMTVRDVGGHAGLMTNAGHLDVHDISGPVSLHGPPGKVTYTAPADPAAKAGLRVHAENATVRAPGRRESGGPEASGRPAGHSGFVQITGQLGQRGSSTYVDGRAGAGRLSGRLEPTRDDPRAGRGQRPDQRDRR